MSLYETLEAKNEARLDQKMPKPLNLLIKY